MIRRSAKLRRPLLALAATLLFLLCAEAAARLALVLLGPGPAPLELGWEEGGGADRKAKLRDQVYRPDPATFFALKPGLELETTFSQRIFDVRTNALGLRGDPTSPQKAAGTWRILCLGDSCTFGSGAGHGETYPAALQDLLRGQRPDLALEVLNGGVPGFSSFQARRFLEARGLDLDPDAVVLCAGFNDASPAEAGAKRDFGAQPLSDLEYARRARPLPRLGLARLARRLKDGAAGGGESAATPETLETAAPSTGAPPRVSVAEYRANLEAVLESCRARSIAVVLIVWPLRAQDDPARSEDPEKERLLPDYQQAARELAAARQATLVDLVPAVDGHADWFVDKVHMNAAGYRRVAELVARALAPHLPPVGSR